MSETLKQETPETHAQLKEDSGLYIRAFVGVPEPISSAFSEKMERDRNRWRSVAEQALAAIDYKRRDWLTEETDNNNIVVGCDRKKFLEALAAFDSLRKEKL